MENWKKALMAGSAGASAIFFEGKAVGWVDPGGRELGYVGVGVSGKI